MLVKANKEDVDQYVEYVYGLSQDYRTSAFPTYLDGIKTKEEFIQKARGALQQDTDEILLFQKERVLGWIHYYHLDEDQYVGFMSFNVEEDAYPQAIDEFVAYCEERYPDYKINFGFPAENRAATGHLKNLGYVVEEESDVYVLHFEEYAPVKAEGDIRPVTLENWGDFQALHRNPDMYWNNERLYQTLVEPPKRPWHLFLYYENGRAVANIYYTYVDDMMEIFGIDRDEEGDSPAILRRLLHKACGESKKDGMKHLVYFADEAESEIVRSVGMKFLTKYVLFWDAKYAQEAK